MKKVIKTLFVFLIFGFVVFLASCGEEKQENTNPGNENSEVTDDGSDHKQEEKEETIPYKISVKARSGKPLKGFTVKVTLPLSNFSKTFTTGADGTVTMNLVPNVYTVELTATDGYVLEQSKFTTDKQGTEISAVCDTYVIQGNPAADFMYTMGDPAYDFALTTIEDEIWLLSDKLEQYDLIVLNFWYTACTWCVQEFPALEGAYEKYSDRVEVLAINPDPYMSDTTEIISNFVANYGLSFNVAKDTADIAALFPISGYPTSVFIDKYGTVDYFESNAITEQVKWETIFNEYLSDDYTPSYKGNGENSEEALLPTTTMPSSKEIENVINTPGFKATYEDVDREEIPYSWPWIISKNGDSIQPSNSRINSSYSILKVKVELQANQVFAFDYLCSSEKTDYFYIRLDDSIIFEAAGYGVEYKTCFAYVALETKEYEFSFGYQKDSLSYDGDDTIYIKNMRYLTIEDITEPIYILRDCSYGTKSSFNGKYQNYVTPVFNEEDGYYHIGNKNGTLMLANLLFPSHFDSKKTIFEYAITSDIVVDEINYSEILIEYANYAANSLTENYTPITQELKNALDIVVQQFGGIRGQYEERWLEMCNYYTSYGPNVIEIKDPIQGLATFNAFKAEEGDNELEISRPTSRGFIFKFIPEKSGVYKIYSTLELDSTTALLYSTNCWVYNHNFTKVHEEDPYIRMHAMASNAFNTNFVLYEYFEEGQVYYLNPKFENNELFDVLPFRIEYVSETFSILTLCSEPTFTTDIDFDLDNIENHIISKGIEYAVDSEGYYHEKLSDQTLGSYIYADFGLLNHLFDYSLKELLNSSAYNFAVTELNMPVYDSEGYLIDWKYQIDDDGNYVEDSHGNFIIYSERRVDKDGNPIKADLNLYCDLTARVKEIVEARMVTDENSELYGLVLVDEELRQILQALMDKYTFRGIEDSWQKLCYYYKNIDASTAL